MTRSLQNQIVNASSSKPIRTRNEPSSARSSPVRQAVEALEMRVLMAGNVTAIVVDGNLTVTGDSAANVITLDQSGLSAHQVRVIGSSVNGQSGSAVLHGVKGNVIIQMGEGVDRVTLNNLNLPQNVSITQSARDSLTIDNVTLGGSLSIRNSSSALPINTTIGDTTVGQNLSITTGDGGQIINLDTVVVTGQTRIATGKRYDVLTVNDSFFQGDVAIDTQRGLDVVQIETQGNANGPRTRFESATTIALGGEADSLLLGKIGEIGNRPWFSEGTRLDGNAGNDIFLRANARFSVKPHIDTFEIINASTDSTAPTVISTDAANLATGIARNRSIAAIFSEPMDSLTITDTTYTLKGPGSTPVAGSVSYVGTTATFTPTSNLAASTIYTATITTGAKDLAGNALVTNKVWTFTTGVAADTTAPTITLTSPSNTQTNVVINKTVAATFSESMDAATLSGTTFTVTGPNSTPVTGVVSYDAQSKIAFFTPSSNLAPSTLYTATILAGSNGAKDLAGNPLAANRVWTFTTGTQVAQSTINLGAANTFAVMATSAINSTGATQINGDVGLSPGTAQGIPTIQVNGTIHVNDQAVISAQGALLAAYNDAVSRSTTPQTLPGNMGGLTFTPGLYTNSTSVLIQGSGPGNDVTLDAQGDPNAVFIFKMGSTLTTGTGSHVILAGGAKAGNIFWQVGTSATLNTTSIFKGNILASVTITVDTGSVVEGRLLAGSNSDGAVTVNASTVTLPIA